MYTLLLQTKWPLFWKSCIRAVTHHAVARIVEKVSKEIYPNVECPLGMAALCSCQILNTQLRKSSLKSNYLWWCVEILFRRQLSHILWLCRKDNLVGSNSVREFCKGRVQSRWTKTVEGRGTKSIENSRTPLLYKKKRNKTWLRYCAHHQTSEFEFLFNT